MNIIEQHPAVSLAIGGYAAIALIATMPAKGSKLTWETVYGWFYDCLHLLLNTPQGSAILQKFQIPQGTQVTQTVSPTQTTTTITAPQETK